VYKLSVLPSDVLFGYVGPGHDADVDPPVSSFKSPCTRHSTPKNISVRGDVALSPRTRGSTSKPSMGGTPAASPILSAGSTPAIVAYVAYLHGPRGAERTASEREREMVSAATSHRISYQEIPTVAEPSPAKFKSQHGAHNTLLLRTLTNLRRGSARAAVSLGRSLAEDPP
jgi:hypothetical protein